MSARTLPGRKRAEETRRRELEFKLQGGVGAFKRMVDALTGKHGFSVEPPRVVTLRDDYYDTPSWWFFHAGVSVRLRHQAGGKRWFTLKSLHPEHAGFLRRTEIEEPLKPRATPAVLSELPPGRVRGLVEECFGPVGIRPVLRLQSRRSFVHCRKTGGHQLAVSLDSTRFFRPSRGGAVPAGHFEEIEVEHLHGNPARTVKMIGRLARKLGLSPSGGSKFERGLTALGVGPSKLDLGVPQLALPDDRLSATAFRVLGYHFEKLRANEAGARLGIDPEGLHDMRVAARRLRTALRTFQQSLPPAAAAEFETDLRWIGGVLGPVRDLDVYLEMLDRSCEALAQPEADVIRRYEGELLVQRDALRLPMIEALQSPRYRRFIARFQSFLRKGPSRSSAAVMANLASSKAAGVIIEHALDNVKRRGEKASDKPAVDRLHKLRIAFKRLRYTCEWFGGLFDSRFRRFLRKTVRMQALLGRHHDAVAAAHRLRESAAEVPKSGSHPGLLLLALGRLIARENKTVEQTEEVFPAAWRKFDRKRVKRRLLDKPLRRALQKVRGQS